MPLMGVPLLFHRIARPLVFVLFLFAGTALSGCSALISSATSDMMSHLSDSILNSDDPAMVETGAPAYLLMIDSLTAKDPDNDQLLATASLLYSAYADLFVKDPERAKKIAAKALDYAVQSACRVQKTACGIRKMPYDHFTRVVSRFEKQDLHALFALGNAWAGWIIANKSDPAAIADLSRIEQIMKQVVQLDETYRQGAPYIYLGSLSSFLPPALGGRPEDGREYFKKALALSENKNLSAKVSFARYYARMVYDRTLHDRLLNEVITADPYVEGYTLINVWSQQEARDLLKSAEDYF